MKLLIVDGDKLRHEGKDFGDFYDFGTHKQFPSIPVGTAVINGNLPDADFLAAVKQGVIEVSESGKAPEDKVYEDERQASLQARKEDPEAHQLYISRFYPQLVKTPGYEVYFIDGEYQRSRQGKGANEFIEGDNPEHNPDQVPQGQIFVDWWMKDPVDREATVVHEYVEAVNMKRLMAGGMKRPEAYEAAHKIATRAEYEFLMKFGPLLKSKVKEDATPRPLFSAILRTIQLNANR